MLFTYYPHTYPQNYPQNYDSISFNFRQLIFGFKENKI